MKKFIKVGIAALAISLALCSCGQAEPMETAPTETDPIETEAETKKLSNYSKILIQSNYISSAIRNQSLDREGLDMEIYAYDYEEIVSKEEIYNVKELAALQAWYLAELAAIKQNTTHSEEERSTQIAQLDSELKTRKQQAKIRYQSKKYEKLSEWFAERGIENVLVSREGHQEDMFLVAFSVMLDDLIALEQSGLHFYYVIQWTEPEPQPELVSQS